MNSRNKIFLFGYSGHAYVVADAAHLSGNELSGYFDDYEKTNNPFDLKYQGDETQVDIKSIISDAHAFVSIGDNKIREKISNSIKQKSIKLAIISHPTSSIADSSIIEDGVFVGPNAVINSLAKIGEGTIINSGAIIEHECTIGNFSHIAPGAILAGNVTIGDSAFIGAGSVIKEGVTVSDNVTIGAGSVVIKNITSGTWVGNPAKRIKDV